MNVRQHSSWARGALVALAAPLLLTGLVAPAHAATAPAGAYAEAYGALVDVSALQGNVPVNTGELGDASSSCPPATGSKTNQLLDVPADPAVHADVLTGTATTDCAAPTSKATARVVNVDALIGTPITVHADAITSTSSTSCTKAPAGSTQVVNLSIAGTDVPIPTDVPPNTPVVDEVLTMLGVRVIVNEQHPAANGRGLVVNGLHIIASGGGTIPVGGTILRGDVVIAHAVSGVVCPGGQGTDNGGLPKPDISFTKDASPDVAAPGTTVTYTAVITNHGASACEVLKAIDHVAPAFDLVSSAGPLGTKLDSPAPKRTDGGVDAVLRPTGVTIGAGKSVTQTFTVKVKSDAAPGTYYDTLELYCGLNGDYVSGPLAPVTVPGAGAPVTGPSAAVETPQLAATGGAPAVAVAAVLLIGASLGVRRLRAHRA